MLAKLDFPYLSPHLLERNASKLPMFIKNSQYGVIFSYLLKFFYEKVFGVALAT